MRTPVFSLLFVAVLCGCSEKWDGYAYPDRSNLRDARPLGQFPDLESCRAAALRMLSSLNSIKKGDYECGLNCDGSNCEKTGR